MIKIFHIYKCEENFLLRSVLVGHLKFQLKIENEALHYFGDLCYRCYRFASIWIWSQTGDRALFQRSHWHQIPCFHKI